MSSSPWTMDEEEFKEVILDFIKRHTSSVHYKEEQPLEGHKNFFGVADITFPDKGVAFEIKCTERSLHRKGVGQAIGYEAYGYDSYLVIPTSFASTALGQMISETNVGLLTWMRWSEGDEWLVCRSEYKDWMESMGIRDGYVEDLSSYEYTYCPKRERKSVTIGNNG